MEWSPWIAGVLAASVFGFLAARLSEDAKAFLTNPATIGWVTAAATFSAAVVALRIAGANDASRRERERQRGQLVAALARAKIPVVGDLLADAEKVLNQDDLTESERVKMSVPSLQKALDLIAGVDHAKVYAYSPHLAAELVNIADMLSLCVHSATKESAKLKSLQRILSTAIVGFRARCRRIEDLTKSARGEAIDPWLDPLNLDGEISRPTDKAESVT